MCYKKNMKVRASKNMRLLQGLDAQSSRKMLLLTTVLALAFLAPMIAAAETNQPPLFSQIGDRTVLEGSGLQFAVSASDPDGDPVNITCQNPPDGAYFNSTTAIFSWEPSYSQAGLYSVTFNATDGKGGETSETITITVLEVNRPPVLDPIDNKAVTEGSLLAFNVTAIDPDTDRLNYFATGLPELTTLNYTTGEFSWIPNYNAAGVYNATFTVYDGKGGNDSKTVLITVEDMNRAPELQSIENKTIAEDHLLTFLVKATDPDGDIVHLTEIGSPLGAILNSTTGNFTWTPNYDQAGNYRVTFVAQDDKGGIDSANVTITVLDTNRSPILSPIENKTVKVGSTLNFTVIATDSDGDKLAFAVIDLPVGADLNATTGNFVWTPTKSDVGLHSFAISVSDGKGGNDNQTIFILVEATNHAPVLNLIGDRTVNETSTLTFTVTATDLDGDRLDITLTSLPQGARFNSTTGVFQWTPSIGQAGNYTIIFMASDGKGGTDNETITITVTPNSDHTKPDDEPNDDLTEGIQDLRDKVKDYAANGDIDNKGIANSLMVKLDATQSKLASGDTKAAGNIIEAFINHVKAQSGKHITEKAAESLIADALDILEELQET